jgi:hypothetical protein
MTSTPLGANALNVTGSHGEAGQFSTSALNRELTREQAEERRWQLEWDRRNLED